MVWTDYLDLKETLENLGSLDLQELPESLDQPDLLDAGVTWGKQGRRGRLGSKGPRELLVWRVL